MEWKEKTKPQRTSKNQKQKIISDSSVLVNTVPSDIKNTVKLKTISENQFGETFPLFTTAFAAVATIKKILFNSLKIVKRVIERCYDSPDTFILKCSWK